MTAIPGKLTKDHLNLLETLVDHGGDAPTASFEMAFDDRSLKDAKAAGHIRYARGRVWLTPDGKAALGDTR